MYTSQHSYIFFAILGIVLAIFILSFSLFSSMAQTPFLSLNVSQRLPLAQIFSGEVLPGHPLYFFARIKDRLYLISTFDMEKKYQTFLEFAEQRIETSLRQYEKQSYGSAIQTAMKSQIYLGQAVQYLQEEQRLGRKKDILVYQHLLGILVDHHRKLIEMKEGITDAGKAELDEIIRYNESLHWVITGIVQ